MNAVDNGATRLEQAADQLHVAVLRFEKAEEVFNLEMAKLRVRVDVEAVATREEGKKGKLPSQDRRHDNALVLLGEQQAEVYTEYFAAKADREAQMVLYRALAAAVSARQSLLKAIGGAGG